MNDYLVMPYNCRWYRIKAKSAEMAYKSEMCWFKGMVAIMDLKTGQTEVFRKEYKEPGILEIVKGVIYE